MHILLIIAAALTAFSVAHAETCLPFEAALERAASRDPSVAGAEAERRQAAADLDEARSLWRPQLSAFGRTGVGDVGAVNGVVQSQVGVRASQRVIDFGDGELARRSARLEESSRAASGEDRRLTAAREVGDAYLERLRALAQLAATNERVGYFATLVERIEGAIAGGGATLAELAEVKAGVAEAEAAAQELLFRVARADAAIALATESSAPACDASTPMAFLDLSALRVVDAEAASALTLSSNPGLKSLEKRRDAAEAARKREARNRLPIIEVVAIGAYSSTGDNDGFGFQDRVGVDVSVPLYSGNAISARNDRASARVALAEADTARARRDLELEARIGFQRIQSLKAQSKTRRIVEAQKADGVRYATTEYDRGLRALPELVEVRLDYEQAILDRIDVEFQLAQEQLSLLALTAQLPIDEAAAASGQPIDDHTTDETGGSRQEPFSIGAPGR